MWEEQERKVVVVRDSEGKAKLQTEENNSNLCL